MVLVRAASVLPRAPGVYRFRSGPRVLYVGRATDLRARVRSYAGDLRDRRHLRRMVPSVTSVEAIECGSVHEAAWLERTLLEQTLPRWNRVRGGAEVPCWLELDGSERSAGLRVCRSEPEGRSYGPYLGTDRAALVVSALRRIAPLDLTRTGLEASAADLARTVGVKPTDRDDLVVRLAGVLRREPEAVDWAVDLLHERRAAAAATEAYEVAARIGLELDALRWATAPQRAAGTLADADLAAYEDGLLVQLAVRGGRLGRWTVRAATPRTAARVVDATPPEWQDLVTSAARLAVALRGQCGTGLPTMGA